MLSDNQEILEINCQLCIKYWTFKIDSFIIKSFMKNIQKQKKQSQKIFIPTLGDIPIGHGTVPSTGKTIPLKKLLEEFRLAAKDNIIPFPESDIVIS